MHKSANNVTVTNIVLGDNFCFEKETYRPVLNSHNENGEFLAFKTTAGREQIGPETAFRSEQVANFFS